MTKKRLGNSAMELTPIGAGAWAMGGGGRAFGWGPQDDAQSIAAIHAALDCGINWIDTAATYGLGHSEGGRGAGGGRPLWAAVRVHQVFPGMGRQSKSAAH